MRDLPPPEVLAAAWRDPIVWSALFIDNTVEVRRGGKWLKYDPGYTPDQKRLGRAIANYSHVCSPAGQNLGKSRLAGLCVHWWLNTRSPAKVITTGPSSSQIKGVLWSEVRYLATRARMPLVGYGLPENPMWRVGPQTYAKGITVRDLNAMGGYHSPNLLVIIEEAAGVDEPIWIACHGLCSDDDGKMLAIGNPLEPVGAFYRASRSSTWHVEQLSCLRHPNVLERRTIFPGMVSYGWVERMKVEWADRPWLWSARVEGEFPSQGTRSLINNSWVLTAMEPGPMVGKPLSYERPVLAIDVADQGDAENAVAVAYGPQIPACIGWYGTSPEETAARAKKLGDTLHPTPVYVVDAVGIGMGVVVALRNLGISVIEYVGAEQAEDPDKYKNRRAEDWWNVAEALREEELRLVPQDKLRGQLVAPEWFFDSAGRVQIQKKEDMDVSPDRADAVVMAHATRRRQVAELLAHGKVKETESDDERDTPPKHWIDRMADLLGANSGWTRERDTSKILRELIGS